LLFVFVKHLAVVGFTVDDLVGVIVLSAAGRSVTVAFTLAGSFTFTFTLAFAVTFTIALAVAFAFSVTVAVAVAVAVEESFRK
jgi:hypothetical protein